MNLQNFNEKTFEEIITEFEPMVKNMIKSLKIYKGFEDFYQCGLIGLWEAYHRFDPSKGYFPSFAKVTVRGKMLSLLKKEKQYETQITLIESSVDQISVATDDQLIHKEALLSYCIDLSPNQRKWVIRACLENKKPMEIAEEEGVSVETVKTWRKKALEKLRKQLKKASTAS